MQHQAADLLQGTVDILMVRHYIQRNLFPVVNICFKFDTDYLITDSLCIRRLIPLCVIGKEGALFSIVRDVMRKFLILSTGRHCIYVLIYW